MNELEKKAIIYTNIAYILADVTNSIVVDLEAVLEKMAAKVNYGELKEFKKMLNDAKALKDRSKKIAKPIYELKEVESAVTDSDWMLEMVLLLVDRVGGECEKANVIREFLINQKSELNIL